MKSEFAFFINPKLILILLFSALFIHLPFNRCFAEDGTRPLELSAGYGLLICQSGYGLGMSPGLEIVSGWPFAVPFKAEAGFRLGFSPSRPDVFLRFCLTNSFGVWKPAIGFESGYTNRMYFHDSNHLMKETREAMTKDLGNFYVASHIEPLAFCFGSNWTGSFLEVDIGTHFNDFGSSLRFNLNIIRICKTFDLK